MNWAHVERLALCDLLTEVGPDAPTRCAGWSTADLAAHLVTRERRPDAGPGILFPLLAGYTDRVRERAKRATPYPRLVELIHHGPPAWSPLGLPGMDAAANTVEYFVHHEDVRRARPQWQPRDLPPEFEAALWRRLKMSRLTLRRLPVQITFADLDGHTQQVTKSGKQVRVHGRAGELILWALGRKDTADVRLTGEAEAVNVVTQGRWRL